MRKFKTIILAGFLALAMLIYGSGIILASDGNDIGLTDSTSYSELTSQLDQWATESSHYSLDMLGIDEIEFNGIYSYGEDGQAWLFQTEPTIRKINPDGPSHNIFENGDVIVAIDGKLITTRRAGKLFANLTPGEPVQFEVRRGYRKQTLSVTPKNLPKLNIPIELSVRCTDQMNRENAVTVEFGKVISPKWSGVIKKIRQRNADEQAETDSLGILRASKYIDRAPRGWIGFGLSFSGSIRRNDPGEPADWFFFDPPTIKSIQPGSPADEAGLRVGDVLVEIDGKKLESVSGSKRFSRMEPGQIVRWKVLRNEQSFTVETKAIERP